MKIKFDRCILTIMRKATLTARVLGSLAVALVCQGTTMRHAPCAVFEACLAPQQPVGVLEEFVHQGGGQLGMGLNPGLDHLAGLGAAVAAQQAGEPVAGEEDVARALHLLEGVREPGNGC